MTYRLGVAVGHHDGEVKAGTNLLVAGSSYTGSLRFVRKAVEEGVSGDDGTVYVTARRPGQEVLDEFEASSDRFAAVDCSEGSKEDNDDRAGSESIQHADHPGDMTNIGVKVSDLLERFHDGRGIDRNRIVLDSVSELVSYSDIETVFRFLHVFTGRVRNVGGLGIFVIDRDAHDDKEYSTIRQLFDAVVEVDGDDDVRVRLEGPTDEPTDWTELE